VSVPSPWSNEHQNPNIKPTIGRAPCTRARDIGGTVVLLRLFRGERNTFSKAPSARWNKNETKTVK